MMPPPKPLKILDDYYLLPTGANIKFVHSLLGRVVENHVYPLQRYEPEDEIVPQELVTGLMGNSNAIESVTETTRLDISNEARVKLTDLVRAHAVKEQGRSATISVYLLKTYDMTQIKPNFARLKEDTAYLAAVTKLFDEVYKVDERTRLPMITKVLVCEDVEVTTTEDSGNGFGGKITAPVTAAAAHGALPKGPLDVEVEFDHTKTKAVEKTKKITGGVVVGLAYTWTEIQNVPLEKKEHLKFMDRVKSLFKPKPKGAQREIVVSNNQYGGPFIFGGDDPDAPVDEGATTAETKDIVQRSSSSEQTVHDKDEAVKHSTL